MMCRKLLLILCFILAAGHTVFGETAAPTVGLPKSQALSGLNEIMGRLEARYSSAAFSASFKQTSTLKAMQVTDTADGKAFFKNPGKMKWEYKTPSPQQIISDGKTLWIHKPEDRQVIIGDARTFFGSGKGASFLSDIKLLRQAFRISREPDPDSGSYKLKLLPVEENLELSGIYIFISKKTFDVTRVITVNLYGDETTIMFDAIRNEPNLKDSFFRFHVPDDVEILSMDQ